MEGRKMVDGKPGDRFNVAEDFEGKYKNAIGVPLQTPRGQPVPIPDGTGPPAVREVVRPDFRKVDKNGPVFGNEK